MSRSGYYDDCDGWDLIRWRGAVASAMRGARGQAFLKEMAAALEVMPEKKLIAEELESGDYVCAIGAVGRARGTPMAGIDPENYTKIARTFGISEALAREVMFENDGRRRESPEERWVRMRTWVRNHIKQEAA